MKSSLNLFDENEVYVTPSDIIEFMYCMRFTYFMKCLGISQHEEDRYKVIKGRNIHEQKSKQNVDYVRKKINGVVKYNDVYLISKNLGLKGIVDEVYELKDGTLAPLDYKFAPYSDGTFQTYKTQMILYSLMIEDVYGRSANKAFLVYCRGQNTLKEIGIEEKMKKDSLKSIKLYKNVIQGYYPKATKNDARCLDCCYSNICEK